MVLKALDTKRDQIVAIKVFDKSKMTFNQLKFASRERFFMSQLKNENVMQLLDSHEDETRMYFVMELMADDLRNVFN